MPQKTRAELITDVTHPTSGITTNNHREISGADLRTILLDIIDSFANHLSDRPIGQRLILSAASFSGNDYQSNFLIGKVADADFVVFADDGAGTKLKENDHYTYNIGTGTLTMTPGNYWIDIMSVNIP